MVQMMNGQGHSRVPGAQDAAPEGGTDRRALVPAGQPSGAAVAVRPTGNTARVDVPEVVITPDLVADLHDPTLVITHGYVGPERRLVGPRHTDHRHVHGPAPSRHLSSLVRRMVSVVALTAAVVIPLTMIAARSVPPAASGQSPTPVTGQATPKPTGGAPRHATKVFGATAQQIARAEAAYQRALARVGGSGAVSPPAPTAGMSGAGGASAGTGTAATPPSVGAVSAETPAEQRAAAAAATATARAQAQAAAAERRTARAAARAQAQAARAAARTGGAGTTGPAPTTGVGPVSGVPGGA
jgi:hypothetical protein